MPLYHIHYLDSKQERKLNRNNARKYAELRRKHPRVLQSHPGEVVVKAYREDDAFAGLVTLSIDDWVRTLII